MSHRSALICGKLAKPTVSRIRGGKGHENLSREEALRLYTVGSAWFSGEEEVKGKIAPGQIADFAILSADYMTVPEEQIRGIESVLTVTGGDVVYSAGPFTMYASEPLPAVSPPWSPPLHSEAINIGTRSLTLQST
jgi:hypothetical protein